LQIEVPAVPQLELVRAAKSDASDVIRERTERAFQVQLKRQGKPNAKLGPKEIDEICKPDAAGEELLKSAIQRMGLSARAYHRVLKVARTIADLAGTETIAGGHIAEAIQYRKMDKA
jgi:magnesium chelatase family protein